MFTAKQQGFTLLELITTCVIFTILATIAFPNLTKVIRSISSETDINTLNTLIYHARSAAVASGQHTTLCALSSNLSCMKKDDWKGTISAFHDPNRNNTLDASETIIHQAAIGRYAASLAWRAFNNRGFIQFSGFGLSTVSNGTFTYCSTDGSPLLQLVMNRQGRLKKRALVPKNAHC